MTKKQIKLMIEEKRIIAHYQPIFCAKTNNVKYEVLARGVCEDGNLISPFIFLDKAKELKMLSDITKIIIDKSFQLFSKKENRLTEFSINISDSDLSIDFFIFIKEQLVKYDIDPKRLTLELLEDILITEDNQNKIEAIEHLQNMELKIAIDDFGVQNANLMRLFLIKADYLKIDRFFLKDVKTDKRKLKFIKHIITFANGMGAKTVIEGIEDEEVFILLKEIGIDYLQGFHMGKPEPYLLS